MRQARHPLWRAVAIFALLLVTQLSYAGELCRGMAGRATPAHAAPAEGAEAMPSARSNCRADPGCQMAASDTPECVASRHDSALNAVAAPAGSDSVIFTTSASPQWTPAVPSASAAIPKLAAASHPPLRNLYCRYLI